MEDHNQDDYHESFEQSFVCFPVSHIKNKEYLEDGNRIIMPQSALDRLSNMKIEYPMMFEIKNPAITTTTSSTGSRDDDDDNRGSQHISHCGVLEFTADEGFVYVPEWMMKNLQLLEGSLVALKYVNLPKGKFMRIQPHRTNFIKLPDPKEVLETALKDFACLTAGDTIMVTYQYNRYYIDILETNPSNAISVVETDCEVEFAPPLDYKEPEKKPKSVGISSSYGLQKVQEKETPKKDDQEPKFRPFTGVARRLGRQVSSGMPPTANVITSEAQSMPQKRPGKLVFGPEEIGNPQSKARRISEEAGDKDKAPDVEEKKFQPFTGKKYTLSG